MYGYRSEAGVIKGEHDSDKLMLLFDWIRHSFESRLEIKSHLKSSPAMSLEMFWKFYKIWEMTDKAVKVRKFWFVKHSSKTTFL